MISLEEHDRRVTELLNAHNLTLERARNAERRVRELEAALGGAIEVIEDAPHDTWGSNSMGGEEAHLQMSWYIKDEHLHYLYKALRGES